MILQAEINSMQLRISPKEGSPQMYNVLCTFNEERSTENRDVWDIAFFKSEGSNTITLVDLINIIDQIFNYESINADILVVRVGTSIEDCIVRKSEVENASQRIVAYMQTLLTKFSIEL